VGNSKIIVPLKGLIDLEEEIARQDKKIQKLEIELKPLLGRINNEKFTSSAPEDVVLKTRERIKEVETEIQAIREIIENLR
jgi:valyl-tRNA synthetase